MTTVFNNRTFRSTSCTTEEAYEGEAQLLRTVNHGSVPCTMLETKRCIVTGAAVAAFYTFYDVMLLRICVYVCVVKLRMFIFFVSARKK